jgi:hypothetical protein
MLPSYSVQSSESTRRRARQKNPRKKKSGSADLVPCALSVKSLSHELQSSAGIPRRRRLTAAAVSLTKRMMIRSVITLLLFETAGAGDSSRRSSRSSRSLFLLPRQAIFPPLPPHISYPFFISQGLGSSSASAAAVCAPASDNTRV